MTKYDELSVELLRQILDYNPDTGLLTWKERPVSMFEDRGGRYTAEWCCRTFNNKHAGKPALTALKDRGYCTGGIFRRTYSAHRVAWALFYGHWVPDDQEIDHINRNPSDNRISNLRLATKTQNGHNKTMRREKSPYVGVTWFSPTGTWVAKVTKDKVVHHIGTFHDPKEAAIARDKKALELYGEHARLNFP
jgi:hypothetical protein